MTVIGVTLQFIDKSCTPINSRISAVAVDDSVPVINPKANTHLSNMIKPIRVMYVSPVSINLQCQVTLHFLHMPPRVDSWVNHAPAKISLEDDTLGDYEPGWVRAVDCECLRCRMNGHPMISAELTLSTQSRH